jgi:DNA-directed RNA polymerase specialized sigma24 family protein
MSEMDSNKILEEVCSQVNKYFTNYPGTHSLKIWLFKIVVRKIIFKISTDLFNAQNHEPHAMELENYSPGNTIYDFRYKHLPLSLKVVYLLTRAGFSEKEVSDILNVNPFKVRERLHKALAIVGDR